MANCFLAMGLSASSAENPSTELIRVTYTQYHMGVDARLILYAPNKETAEKAGRAAFAKIATLDSIMSDYQTASELNRLCKRAGTGPVRVSGALFTVLRRSQQISKLTDGGFDVTASPLIRLWRQARRDAKLPATSAIAAARRLVGFQKMILDEKALTVELKVPGMQLDLGGIAKGYACDEAQRILKTYGITRALVEMGGDIVVTGPPPDAPGWTIRVANASGEDKSIDRQFANCAVSTSGDTEQFVVIGGVQYSHVVDPRTGQALTNRIQATVVAPDGLTSDPVSTSLTLIDEVGRARLQAAYPGTTTFIRSLAGKS